MDGCVLLTSTPSCVVSPQGDPSGCALGIARRGETTHSGVDVNNTHPSMINPFTNPLFEEKIIGNSRDVFSKKNISWICLDLNYEAIPMRHLFHRLWFIMNQSLYSLRHHLNGMGIVKPRLWSNERNKLKNNIQTSA